MSVIGELRSAVVNGEAKVAVAATKEGLGEGLAAATLLHEGLIAAMGEVGELYEQGELYVPEMLLAARAMNSALSMLRPQLMEESVPSSGTVAIGSVKGDLHDIGKNLVAMMFEGCGFEIVDLGVDVPSERFVEAVRDGAQVVAMSALLTTTMINMRDVVQALRDAGLRERARIVIGGAPITAAYASEIGADGSAPDAFSAVRLVRELLASAQS